MANPIDDLYDTIIEECQSWPVEGPEALGPAAGGFRSLLVSDAAVAAAVAGSIALVGPAGENVKIMMTNAEVKAYGTNQGHKTTNEAMKYIRDHVGEKEDPGWPGIRALEVTTAHLGGGLTIPVMTKPKNTGSDEGMDYSFHYNQAYRTVDCKAMIANLPTAKRDKMLGAHHVCRMTLEWVPNTYDRKRRDMAQKCRRWTAFPENAPVPVWDWHLLLSDGSVWRFHTDWSVKKASITVVKPGDQLPRAPVQGINQSDGPGSYNRYKYGNYDPTRAIEDAPGVESAVADAEAEDAPGVESAVAEAESTAAASGDVMGSPVRTVRRRSSEVATTEIDTTSEEEFGVSCNGDLEKCNEHLRRMRPNETSWRKEVAEGSYVRPVSQGGGSGSNTLPEFPYNAVDQVPSWGSQTWGAGAWSTHTHGYGVGYAVGATAILQPDDTNVHAEISALHKQDEDNQEGGGGTDKDKAVRFNETATIHYTEGRSSDAAEAIVAAGPPAPEPLPYTGSDARRATENANAIRANREYRDRWVWASKSWWQTGKRW
jgi:hypothetical protein